MLLSKRQPIPFQLGSPEVWKKTKEGITRKYQFKGGPWFRVSLNSTEKIKYSNRESWVMSTNNILNVHLQTDYYSDYGLYFNYTVQDRNSG